MKTLSIVNRTNAILVINLPHNIVPECATRGVVGVREHNAETGERTLVAHRKQISGSVTLLAKGSADGADRVDGLPPSVRMAPDVKRYTASKAIDVIDVIDDDDAAKPASPKASAPVPAAAPANVPAESKLDPKKAKGA